MGEHREKIRPLKNGSLKQNVKRKEQRKPNKKKNKT